MQTKLIAFKRAKITKVVLRFKHVEASLTCRGMVALRRGEHFELGSDKKTKGQVI